jgi:hypothetical protein
MANSNQVGLAIWEESTFGTLPVAQDLASVRFTSESLSKRTSSSISQELRTDRQIADIVRTSIGAGGSIEGEFSYGSAAGVSSAQDLLIEAALQSVDWVAAVTNAGTYSGSANSITGTNVSVGIVAGRWVRFKDDVVLRIVPTQDGAGSRVDMRSTSRIGVSDLGVNAKRIRAFLQALSDASAAN